MNLERRLVEFRKYVIMDLDSHAAELTKLRKELTELQHEIIRLKEVIQNDRHAVSIIRP